MLINYGVDRGMSDKSNSFISKAKAYKRKLHDCLTHDLFEQMEVLCSDLESAWINGQKVYICGNGGSAGNAIHIANDFHYGIGACGPGENIPGLKIEALPANQAVLTCLANDTGYENIYSFQLDVNAEKGDLLIVLSGSGNSNNIINALYKAKDLGMKTFAITAFSGGKAKDIADCSLHIAIDDMQIAEDLQLIICHMIMQWISMKKPPSKRHLG